MVDIITPSFNIYGHDDIKLPILLSVPHCGRFYPPEILGQLRISPSALIKLEDRYVDILAAPSKRAGFPNIMANMARAWIDLNRAPDEVDAQMIIGARQGDFAQPSAKVRGGLGLIPRRMAPWGDIWKGRMTRQDLDNRIENFHIPYHEKITQILGQMKSQFGSAMLIDLHSMPPILNGGDALTPYGGDNDYNIDDNNVPDIVIGDIFGSTCDNYLTDLVINHFSQLNYVCRANKKRKLKVAMNAPYAGGYILRRHSRPARGIYAIQIEIGRHLYLDENLFEPITQSSRIIGGSIALLITKLAEIMLGQHIANAAE
ncbi:hypothetical protein LPB140_10280 [Sphingorhabdus lutea]|uniref:N-formylglutamate amidohydrolase n=1 Tax=Sphingorhabdus lutea TaxID=1913578 RepID=A0A1L3JD97_9SPHN|nr:N-formylglutamate amidohydrolase [Sphingorhabdus lutea]APG63106.1 hypothetical protein LPB140_10280 [Sphingorhabdus lutea]